MDWHIPRPTLSHSAAGRTRLPRGSASSQGSVESNASTQSTQSVRSGTVLLSAANLTWNHSLPTIRPSTGIGTSLPPQPPKEVDNDSAMASNDSSLVKSGAWTEANLIPPGTVQLQRVANMLDASAKQADTVSIASSTHFTVVNGMGGGPGPKGRSRGSGCGGHHLTALVLTMSLLILLGILAAILFIETRARKMSE